MKTVEVSCSWVKDTNLKSAASQRGPLHFRLSFIAGQAIAGYAHLLRQTHRPLCQRFGHCNPLRRLDKAILHSKHKTADCTTVSSSRPIGYRGREGNQERVVPEDDPRYRRVDMSELHAFKARQALVENIMKGEAGVNLAEAALQVAAEDDAIVSHSSVQLPLRPFMQRIQRLANEALHQAILPLGDASPETVITAVETHLFQTMGFKTPPVDAMQDGRWAYLNQVLPSKIGIPSALAIIYAQVMQALLEQGSVQFAVRMDISDPHRVPRGVLIPGLTRSMLMKEDGGVLNSCTSEALVSLLRYLKQSYWPFALLDSADMNTFGGFRGAAMALLTSLEDNAERHAVAFASSYRLERGIWTASHMAGDIRRAKAAAERLAILVGDSCPMERRDLAVLLMHCGEWAQAEAELTAYRESGDMKEAAVQDQVLVDKLLSILRSKITSSRYRALPPLSCEVVMKQQPPAQDSDKRLPLEW